MQPKCTLGALNMKEEEEAVRCRGVCSVKIQMF